MAADGVGHDEVENGAGGLVRIVDDGLGDLGIDECGVGGVSDVWTRQSLATTIFPCTSISDHGAKIAR